jgi:hypothetical protein
LEALVDLDLVMAAATRFGLITRLSSFSLLSRHLLLTYHRLRGLLQHLFGPALLKKWNGVVLCVAGTRKAWEQSSLEGSFFHGKNGKVVFSLAAAR